MALTLKEVEARGLLSELSSCFDTEVAAASLLARLDVPPGRFRPFASMETEQWWRHVCQQLDRGLVEDGLERLLRAAAETLPGNRLFAAYRAVGSELLEDRAAQGQAPSETDSRAERESPEGLRVFLSYAREDKEQAASLYAKLKQHGFKPWMDEEDLLPGQSWRTTIQKAIRQADVFLVLLSRHSSKRGYVQKEIRLGIETWEERPEGDIFLIPALVEPTEIPERLREIHPVYLYEKEGFRRLTDALGILASRESGDRTTDSRQNLIITRVELADIRCFEHLDLRFEQRGEAVLTTMVLGDNGAGKSTLLRSIALGLCNESDAVALMKEVPGGFVRRGAPEGRIEISLEDAERGDAFRITTRVIKTNGRADEVVRKTSRPAEDFPWDQIFVCGYGTQRANQAVTSHDEYSVRDAVRSLFDDGAALQNPELVLLRLPPDLRADIERRLFEVLMLDNNQNFLVADPKTGLEIRGPWGQQPLSALSDGYRSTAQWLLDFVAWLIYADRLQGRAAIGGILLIDEIEQHLHPRWQRHVVQRLRRQFPRTQIIASTHTPLVAAGTIDVEDSMLVRLTEDGRATILEKALIAGKRADQVLASEAFGLVTTRSPASQHEISRYAELLGMDRRTEVEDAELRELKERIVESLRWGENAFERTVEKAVDQALAALVHEAPRELIDLEAKRQLREIFGSEKRS